MTDESQLALWPGIMTAAGPLATAVAALVAAFAPPSEMVFAVQ